MGLIRSAVSGLSSLQAARVSRAQLLLGLMMSVHWLGPASDESHQQQDQYPTAASTGPV